MTKKKNKKNNKKLGYTIEFKQPYTTINLPNGGFSNDAVDKLIQINEDDLDKLDEWIVIQLKESLDEIEEDDKQLEFDFEDNTTLEEQRAMFDRLFK